MNRLDQIEARADAATKGPWVCVLNGDESEVTYANAPITWDDHGGEVFTEGDAEFIAHARTDVPALVAALYEVLDQHQRVVLPTYLPIGRMEDVSICGVCTVEGEPADWPCPTVETIRQHLGDDL